MSETHTQSGQLKLGAEDLPIRQRDVLHLISTLSEEHGYPPTLAELAKALGLKNRMTVHQHVAALKKKGFVHWEPGLNRSLRVLSDYSTRQEPISLADQRHRKNAAKGIPLAGTIAAGRPIDALETTDYLEIDSKYVDAGCFALKVKGDSMIEEGIYEGDFVIVKPSPSPRNGEIVVALLEDGSATLKRLYKEHGQFRLQPGNKNYRPILIDGKEELEVQGVVVALYRKF